MSVGVRAEAWRGLRLFVVFFALLLGIALSLLYGCVGIASSMWNGAERQGRPD